MLPEGRSANRGRHTQFKKLLAPGRIGQTLCLGNLTDKHTYEYLRTVAPDLKIVKGRLDVEAASLPLTQVVTHGSVRVGFLEGFTLVSSEPDVLLAEANRLDVDVLCWGGTHRFECFEYMDKFFVNPGSATGAYSTGWAKDGEEMVPSFCLMDVSCFGERRRQRRRATGGPGGAAPCRDADQVRVIGSRDLVDPLRLPTTKRRQRRRKCGRGEGDVHKTGGARWGALTRDLGGASGERERVVT